MNRISKKLSYCKLKQPGQEGVVLIALLWILAALSLLSLSLASTVRTEVNVAQAGADAEKAYFWARGATEMALYGIAFPKKEIGAQEALFPYAGGMNHFWVGNEDTLCHVAVLDESGKVDLNHAAEAVLERLLRNLGVEESTCAAIAKDIVSWRTPSTGSNALSEGDKSKHQPFSSTEELLSIEGVTREMLYGMPQKSKDGKLQVKRGLIDFVTVYSGMAQININYAEPEVLATLPGVDMDRAMSIVTARLSAPFKSGGNLSQRFTGIISGEALSMMTTEPSLVYCLVSTAIVKGSNVKRSLKVVAKKKPNSKTPIERLIWYDECWPAIELLNWVDVKPGLDFRQPLTPADFANTQGEI